jgi:hypothetical protein
VAGVHEAGWLTRPPGAAIIGRRPRPDGRRPDRQEAGLSAHDGSEGRRPTGAGRIDDHPAWSADPPVVDLTFTFDGAPVSGRVGEPIAAALFAAGVRVFRTMPDSGEPRGGFCLVGRCTDCLVVVDGRPNVRACITSARAGLRVETQRGLGEGVDFDVAARRPGR